MTRILIVLIALTAGCGIPEPINRELDPPEGSLDAIAIVATEWSERIAGGDDLIYRDPPPVRWFEGPCLSLEGADEPCTFGAYARATFAEPQIFLVLRPTFNQSALAHEMLHWSLDEIAGEPDHDHGRYAWAQVADVEAALRRAGL